MVGELVYLALAGFVAWDRFGPESFTGRPACGVLDAKGEGPTPGCPSPAGAG
jgi:hypothetical protein